MITVGCILQAHHRLPESVDIGDLDTPEGIRKLKEWGDLHDKAHIVTLRLTEDQAERIRDRLWPDKALLGATCGGGFPIETPEQVAAVNEILKPGISINFSQETHMDASDVARGCRLVAGVPNPAASVDTPTRVSLRWWRLGRRATEQHRWTDSRTS